MPRFRRYLEADRCYFVTTATYRRRPLFADPGLCRVLEGNLKFYRDRMKFGLHGYVIMPDHVHLMITPRQPATISDVMRNFKSYAAKEVRHVLAAPGPVWQSRFHDRVIRGEDQFHSALDYIHLNPVKARLVQSAISYEFSSCRFWEEGTGPIALDPPGGHGWGRDLREVGSSQVAG
jgi:REP element-mobilizing transposase RayT